MKYHAKTPRRKGKKYKNIFDIFYEFLCELCAFARDEKTIGR